jgi:hypothetical protein
MWPRHTGDFSIFRVYADKDGNPANYSENNVPLKPKHHLPINLNDKKEGDFAMIMGYPGSTERYLPSWGVEQAINVYHPANIKIRKAKLDVLKGYMTKSDKDRIDYSSTYAGLANYWKNSIGMVQALTKLNTVAKKQKIEKDFSNWIETNEALKKKYGNTLPLFKEFYDETNDLREAYTMLYYGPVRYSDIVKFVSQMNIALIKYVDADKEKRAEMKSELENVINSFFTKHNLDLERDGLVAQLNIYSNDAAKQYQPEILLTMAEKNSGNFSEDINEIFKESLYSNQEKLIKFLKNPKSKYIKNDELGKLANELTEYRSVLKKAMTTYKYKSNKAYRLFVAGLREMNPTKAYAPDANFTMRLTYGQILPYDARDAVKYKYTTTIEGIMQKMDNTNPEFVVPEKLVELYNAKDYGQYANSQGELIVGFLSNNDITGGNSGSPVIDGEGRLIGTAFDGNWEAMSGDVEFEQNLQRTISVDIRYTLFIIDKFAGAKNLIDEMTIIKN